MMQRSKNIAMLLIASLPFWAASISMGQQAQAGDSEDRPAEAQARIGRRTGVRAEILKPTMLSQETRTAMKTVSSDGTIVAIGGHNSMSTDRMLANLALQRAAGLEPDVKRDMFKLPKKELEALQHKVKVLVFTQASGEDEGRKKRAAGVMFDTAGIPRGNVTVLGNEVTESIPLDGYHLIYLWGGDQNAIRALFADKVVQDLHDYLNHGGMIAGTSAGAAILSRKMFAGGREEQDGTLTPDVVELREGFGFFEAMSIDMHLFQYVRFARSLGALALIDGVAAGVTPAIIKDEPKGGAGESAQLQGRKAQRLPIDDVMLSLGQDSVAVIQALDLTGKREKTDNPKPIGAVKVTIAGTTQSWLYQCGENFTSDLHTLQRPNDLAEQWDVRISVVAPGSWFVIKW